MSTTAPEQPPTLNDLRVLAAALPPSERVMAGEAADIISAVSAVVTRGTGVLAAAKEGGTAVYDYFHQQAVDHAAANDHPEPVRGTVAAPAAEPVAPASAAIDYDKLAAAIVKAQTSATTDPTQSHAPSPAADEQPADTHEGNANPTGASAPSVGSVI
jgi:hypothetical protein